MRYNLRELRGLGIVAQGGQIRRISPEQFQVKSQSSNEFHQVVWQSEGHKWLCECADFEKTTKKCKHIFAVSFLQNLPQIVIANAEENKQVCVYCKGEKIVKRGRRQNKKGTVQLLWCKGCKRRFPETTVLGKGGSYVALAIIALDLHYKGLSLRNISDHIFQIHGILKPPSTIQYWISKFTKISSQILNDKKLEVGDTWLADEMFVRIRGKRRYLWSILDFETRQVVVSLLLRSRGEKEAEKVLIEAILRAGKSPLKLHTDGLASYGKALKRLGRDIDHIKNVGIGKKDNNNRIEKFHNTVRGWERNFRGLKDGYSLSLGFSNYYNHVRPNLATGNHAPSSTRRIRWVKVLNESPSALPVD